MTDGQTATESAGEPSGTITRDEALGLLNGGDKGIAEWNRRRAAGEEIPDLRGADLSGAYLHGATLWDANLSSADLWNANLSSADLSNANLLGANLCAAVLVRAKLCGAALGGTNFGSATLHLSEFTGATMSSTALGGLDLTDVRGLESIVHLGPSHVATDTLAESRGRVPAKFLRGCGLQPWEIEAAKIYDPELTALQVADIQAESFRLRTEGPLLIGGIFISYSHKNADFVTKIYDRLTESGASVWLDKHDIVAGPIKRQVLDALRVHDIVLLVLSADAVHESDWVAHEVKMARKRERKEKRDILCPVALDASWEDKMDDPDWGHLQDKAVLDFSKWKTKAFEAPFRKLLDGLKKYYPPEGNCAQSAAP